MTQQEYEEIFKENENAPTKAATSSQGRTVDDIHDNTSEIINAIRVLASMAIMNRKSEQLMWRLRSIIEVLQEEKPI